MAVKDKAKAASMAVKLTLKQEAFCLAYIETGNAEAMQIGCKNHNKLNFKVKHDQISRL